MRVEQQFIGEGLENLHGDLFEKGNQASKRDESDILEKVGVQQLRGVLVQSMSSLTAGFKTASGRNSVRIHEFFAFLVEYFFKSPASLKTKDRELCRTLEDIFHQDPASVFKLMPFRLSKVVRIARCLCGSGEEFKRCCLSNATRTDVANAYLRTDERKWSKSRRTR